VGGGGYRGIAHFVENHFFNTIKVKCKWWSTASNCTYDILPTMLKPEACAGAQAVLGDERMD